MSKQSDIVPTQAANLPPVTMTPAVPVAKLSTGIVDTIGKFVLGLPGTNVLDTGGKNLHKFSKRFDLPLMLFSGAWGQMIH
jgi:hypothetical protein